MLSTALRYNEFSATDSDNLATLLIEDVRRLKMRQHFSETEPGRQMLKMPTKRQPMPIRI